jgi:hypothetical protein
MIRLGGSLKIKGETHVKWHMSNFPGSILWFQYISIFFQFSGKKLAFFSQTNVMIQFLQKKLAVIFFLGGGARNLRSRISMGETPFFAKIFGTIFQKSKHLFQVLRLHHRGSRHLVQIHQDQACLNVNQREVCDQEPILRLYNAAL